MTRAEFSAIRWKPRRSHNKNKSPGPWVGFDTETCRGNVRVLSRAGESGKGFAIWDPSVEDALDIMYGDGSHRGVFYNIRFDIECILKKLPRSNIEQLISPDNGETRYRGYSMRYIPKKCFMLSTGDFNDHRTPTVTFYDALQFYNSSLKDAAQRHLGADKYADGLSKETVRLLGRDPAAWTDDIKPAIERYCISDASLAARLMGRWEANAESLQVSFRNPISPAYLAGEYALARGWPRWTEQHHEVLGPVAWAAYSGGRFESREKGWFPELHSYDIRSAYPAEMVELPEPDAPWTRRTRESVALGDAWGFVECDISISAQAEWGPLAHRAASGPIYYPVGGLGKRWVTLDEYRWLRQHRDITRRLTFIKAWTCVDSGKRPLSWLREMFEHRAKLKAEKDPREAVEKVLMNSTYGKMMQRKPVKGSMRRRPVTDSDDLLSDDVEYDADGLPYIIEPREWEMGPLFNPVWGAHVTARTRLKLLDIIVRYDVASVATDGILATEKISELHGQHGLGSWDADGGCKAGVIVGNGLYQREGEKPKRRGFAEPLQGFAWLDALRASGPRAVAVQVEQERPLHPGEVMKSRKWTQDDIGNFVSSTRIIRLNDDKKRRFARVDAGKLLSQRFVGKPRKIA